MEAKHTPSPWEMIIPKDAPEYVLVTNKNGCLYVGRKSGQEGADAKLIASAPELLKVLIKLKDEYSFSLRNQGGILGLTTEKTEKLMAENNLLKLANDVIKKATE